MVMLVNLYPRKVVAAVDVNILIKKKLFIMLENM